MMKKLKKGSFGLANVMIVLLVVVALILFIVGLTRMFNWGTSVLIVLVIFSILYVLIISLLLSVRSRRKKVRQNKENFHLIKKIVAEPHEEVQEKKVDSKFVGTTKNKKYHLVGCRFTKRIEPEYAVYKDSTSYYKKHGFVACKSCKPDKE